MVSWVPSLYRHAMAAGMPAQTMLMLSSSRLAALKAPRLRRAFSPEPSRSSDQHPPQAAWHSTAESYPGYVSL